jgi:hypothetical protein
MTEKFKYFKHTLSLILILLIKLNFNSFAKEFNSVENFSEKIIDNGFIQNTKINNIEYKVKFDYNINFENTNELKFEDSTDINSIVKSFNNKNQISKISNLNYKLNKNLQFEALTINFIKPEFKFDFEIKPIKLSSLKIKKSKISSQYLDYLIKLSYNKYPFTINKYNTKLRGLDIENYIFVPFIFKSQNEDQVIFEIIEEVKFDLKYLDIPKEIELDKLSKQKNNSIEKQFFSNILNSNHLLQFREIENNNKLFTKNKLHKFEFSLQTQKNTEWFNSNIDYYQIRVTKDGIVQVSIEDLLKINPNLSNLDYQYLKILKNGDKYPFYYKSNDNLISNDDEIFFFGTKAIGDSTKNDFYTNEQKFYLYYDTEINDKFLNLKEFKESGVYSPIIDAFKANYRIEKDLAFGHGYDFANCDHTFGEFWYWDILYPISKNKSNINLDLYFDYESVNDFYFGAEYKNYTYNNRAYTIENGNLKIYNNLDFNLNQNKISSKLFEGLVYDTLSNTINKNNLNFGLNYTEFNAKHTGDPKLYENKPDILDAIIGIESYLFKGSIKPIAYDGYFNAEKTSLDYDNNYYVEGFNNQEIVFVDTLNKEISFPNSDSGYSIIANTKLNNITQIEVKGLKDNRYFNTSVGYHILSIDNNNLFKLYTFNVPNEFDINNSINKFIQNDFCVILINTPNKSVVFNTYLTNNGAINVTTDTNSSYIVIFSKGKVIVEKSSQDITNLHAFVNGNSNNFRAKLFNNANKNEIFVISDSSHISKLKIEKVEKSNLKDVTNEADLIVITHSKFINGANEYAKYKAEKNNIKVKVIDKEDIYKEFSFGKESPQSIKSFLKYAFDNWSGNKFSFLTIIGDASWDPIKRNTRAKSSNYVPVYGWPTTDTWYGLLDDEVAGEKDYLVDIGIGRIPVNEDKEVFEYLDKIKEYDNLPSKKWMSNIINLSGGSAFEIDYFYGRKSFWLSQMDKFNLCYDTVNIKKKGDSPVGNNQGGEVRGAINNGAFWVSFLGHASANVYDLDGWQVNTLNNKAKYPILTSLSCNTGAFAEPEFQYSRSEEYVLTPNRGFIVSFASTFTGFEFSASVMQLNMFASISNPNLKYRNTASILNYSKINLGVPDDAGIYDQTEIDILLQNCLIGDPLVDIKIGDGYDLFFEENDFKITNETGSNEFIEGNKKVIINGIINNNGYKIEQDYNIKLIHTFNGITTTKDYTYNNICLSQNLEFEIDIENQVGQHYFKLVANPDNILSETNFENNTIEFNIYVFRKSLLPIEPQNNWNVDKENPEFIFINPFVGNFVYEMKIVELLDSSDLNDEKVIYNSINDDIKVFENKITFNPKIELEVDKQYIISAKYIDLDNINNEVNELKVLFWADENYEKESLILENNSNYSLSKGYFSNTLVQNKEISLDYINYEYKISGTRGDDFGTILRRILVQYKDTLNREIVFQDGSNELGFHILKFSALQGKDEPIYRYYNTWESTTHPDTTSHVELVKFLRDSIGDDEYVFVATMGETARMFLYEPFTKFTNLDSLKSAFKKFNSEAINKYGWGSTFAMSSKVEGDNFILISDSTILYNTIEMNGTIKQARNQGYYISDWISPYKDIESITYKAVGNVILDKIILKSTFNNSINDTLNSENNNLTEKINENEFKIKDELLNSFKGFNDFKLVFKLDKEKSFDIVKLSDIMVNYIPSQELAIVKSKVSLDSSNYLRGYSANIKFTIENLSNRFESQDIFLKYTINNTKGTLSELLEIGDINFNENKEIEFKLSTEFLDTNNIIILELCDKEGNVFYNELYKFNNNYSFNLNVKEDNVKPTIRLTADDKLLKDKDFIAKKPKFKVEIEDNSPLDFQSTQIQFLLNRYLIKEDNCIEFDYQNYENNDRLKATMEFVWENDLDFGENSVSVRALDRTGNRADTIDIKVFVSRDGLIKDLINYPNPTNENTNIKFKLLMPENNAKGSVYLYDELGNNVNKYDFDAVIGENDYNFELKNQSGSTLSSGRYYYFVKMHTTIYIEDVSGIIILNK